MTELAEGARLEIVCAVNRGTPGSNPGLSALRSPTQQGVVEQAQTGLVLRDHSSGDEIMYYIYFLKSIHHELYYTGCTCDLKKCLEQHNPGISQSTKHYAPFELTANIAVRTSKQASDLEKYFKTGSGKAFVRKRILRCEAAER